MQLFLTLLRIIGILILAVILLVLLVVLLVLLCPVRYRAIAARESERNPEVTARVTWLLHFLRVRVDYGEKLSYCVKVLGITLLKDDDVLGPKEGSTGEAARHEGEAVSGEMETKDGEQSVSEIVTVNKTSESGVAETKVSEAQKPEAQKPEAQKPEAQSTEATKSEAQRSEVQSTEATKSECKRSEQKTTEARTIESQNIELQNVESKVAEPDNQSASNAERKSNAGTALDSDLDGAEQHDSEKKSESEQREKIPLGERIGSIINRIAEFLADLYGKIPEKIAEALEKIASFLEKASEYPDTILEKIEAFQKKKDKLLRQINDEQNRTAVKAILATVGSLLKHICPQKLKITGRLGFDDPATTGQIFGVIGMLMPLYGDNIHLQAVFDEAVMEGRLEMRGRIRIGTVLYMALRLIMKKEVRRLIAQVKRLKKA